MFIESNLASLFLITTLVLGVALIVLSNHYYKMLDRFKKLKREEEQVRNESRHKAQRIVSDARDASEHIIFGSEEKAEKIIQNATLFSNELADDMKGRVARATDTQVSRYKETLQKTQEDTINTVKTISEDIKKQTETLLQGFAGQQATDTKALHTKLEQFMQTQTQQISQELNVYKKEQMHRIDRLVQQRVRALVAQVLPQSLTSKDHEQLIMQALERVKEKSAQSSKENPVKEVSVW